MDCRAFEEWLDEGRPVDDAATAHAATCEACAQAFRDADEWEHALSQRFAVAPDGFTDRVMARLPAHAETGTLSVPEDRESPWPWWLQVLFEPAAALGLLLGLLYAAAAPALMGAGQEVAPSMIARLAGLLSKLPGPAWLESSAGHLALIAAAAIACVGLFRGSVALFDRLTRLRAR